MGALVSAMMRLCYDDGSQVGGFNQCNSVDCESSLAGAAGAVRMVRVPLRTVKVLTQNFSSKYLVAESPSGRLFRVPNLLGDGHVVALKELRGGASASQPIDEFLDKVAGMGRLHHPHVVKLLAYCYEQPYRLLGFEYAQLGSLHDLLHGRKHLPELEVGTSQELPAGLTWVERLRVASGAAQGLAYLMEGTQLHVQQHAAVASWNVLVFAGHVGKISNLRVVDDMPEQISVLQSEQVLGSASHYIAPEYTTRGCLTKHSDTYSFGVVLLEILTGRKPGIQANADGRRTTLVLWSQSLLDDDKQVVEECLDPNLRGQVPPTGATKLARIAAACLEFEPDQRPRMSTVAADLQKLLNAASS